MPLDIHEGETLGIIGPNGAGKTTLFNALNGIVRPASGGVVFEGHSLIGLSTGPILVAASVASEGAVVAATTGGTRCGRMTASRTAQ